MELQEFKDYIRQEIKQNTNLHDSLIQSTCPVCIDSLSILNSHKCGKGWESYHKIFKDNPQYLVKILLENIRRLQEIRSSFKLDISQSEPLSIETLENGYVLCETS